METNTADKSEIIEKLMEENTKLHSIIRTQENELEAANSAYTNLRRMNGELGKAYAKLMIDYNELDNNHQHTMRQLTGALIDKNNELIKMGAE